MSRMIPWIVVLLLLFNCAYLANKLQNTERKVFEKDQSLKSLRISRAGDKNMYKMRTDQLKKAQSDIEFAILTISDVDVEYAKDFPGGVDLKMQIVRQALGGHLSEETKIAIAEIGDLCISSYPASMDGTVKTVGDLIDQACTDFLEAMAKGDGDSKNPPRGIFADEIEKGEKDGEKRVPNSKQEPRA